MQSASSFFVHDHDRPAPRGPTGGFNDVERGPEVAESETRLQACPSTPSESAEIQRSCGRQSSSELVG